MPEKSSGNPESSQEVRVTDALTMKNAMVALAGPRRDGDTRESMLSRAARRAGISFRQAKSLYYGEARDPRASVLQRVTEAVQRLNKQAENDARETVSATDDITQLLASARQINEDLHREVLALVLHRLAGPGPEDSALD